MRVNENSCILALGHNKNTDGPNTPLLLIPIEVLKPRLDAQGNDTGTLKGADSLKVAQWEKAWKTDSTPYGELVDDFLDKDPDRFYVRVPIVGTAESMKVKLSTVDAGGDTIDDWEEIEMQVDPENAGMLKSKSQILVVDTPDKTAAGTSDSEEITPRTHKVSLLGKVKFQIHIGQAIAEMELPVPGFGKYKTVSVHAVVLRNTPGGSPAASEAYVWNDLVNNVKPAFAQANINILIGSVTVADPPVGVDLSDGLALAGTDSVPQEVKTLVNALGTPSADDIHVFYVPSITVPNNGQLGGKGFAIVDSYYQGPADRPYVYNAFMGVTQMNFLTTAHEIGHLLTDAGHPESSGGLLEIGPDLLRWQRNLMYGGNSFVPREVAATVYDSKRLWNSQVKAITSNPHAK